VNKHRTSVGSQVRVGSNNTLVAPVSIGDGAATGANTTVLADVPAGALAVNDTHLRIMEGWTERRRPGTAAAEAAQAAQAPAPDPSSTSGSSGSEQTLDEGGKDKEN
jgi:bifunctional UDP-N-acetylglucosamine pyrophosphorylase/glucosamine-1-phosphate N-acetyltransferase